MIEAQHRDGHPGGHTLVTAALEAPMREGAQVRNVPSALPASAVDADGRSASDVRPMSISAWIGGSGARWFDRLTRDVRTLAPQPVRW